MIVFVNASGYIYISEAETCWPIAGIVDGLGVSEAEAGEMGKVLREILGEI